MRLDQGEKFAGDTARILFSLDNEPDLWSSTHARIHPDPVGYAELVDKNVDFAGAVKDVAPNAVVTGFVSYGYAGYTTLQNAPDMQGEFISYYLQAMADADAEAGHRLVDVLDLHWYSEVYANGQSETIMGEALRRLGTPRLDVVLSTKFFWASTAPGPASRRA